MTENTLAPGVLTFQYRVPFGDLGIEGRNVATGMGYHQDVLSKPFAEQLEQLVREAGDHADIRCGFRVFPREVVKLNDSHFQVAETLFQTGTIIADPLREAESLVFFAATAGVGMTEWADRLIAADEHHLAYFVDAIGSVAVEKAADWLEDKIIDWAIEQDLYTSNRYSPGYCEWDVSEQHKFFALLPEAFCGISLTESALMQPTKSVSGVLGIGSKVERRAYACAICTMVNCFRRHTDPH